MNIYIANDARPQQGGGWSFINYFSTGFGNSITTDYNQADIVFIAGASLVKPEVAEQAKLDGKKVVLRVDNALKHSRNGGKGMARMQRVAKAADLVVYQCQWAKDYLEDYLGHPDSTIIYNGVDLDIFKPEGGRIDYQNTPVYLYAAASKSEGKRWDWAWWRYQHIQKDHPNALLLIAGRVSTPVMENNFDFFQNENYKYLGMATNPHDMATIYRSAQYFFACAENDCYSNAILEALACGLELDSISHTGGTPELLANWQKGREYNGIGRMVEDYKQALNNRL